MTSRHAFQTPASVASSPSPPVDHIVPVENYPSSYTSATTRSSDVFRHRVKRPADLEEDDVDLSLDYDSKVLKARQRRQSSEAAARKRDWRITFVLTLWASYIRLWKIWQPSSVV